MRLIDLTFTFKYLRKNNELVKMASELSSALQLINTHMKQCWNQIFTTNANTCYNVITFVSYQQLKYSVSFSNSDSYYYIYNACPKLYSMQNILHQRNYNHK